jgi:hypothetical protein
VPKQQQPGPLMLTGYFEAGPLGGPQFAAKEIFVVD